MKAEIRKHIKVLVCWLLLVLFVLLSTVTSFAEGSSYIECDCFEEPCICFIQEGDEGGFVKEIIKLLKEKKYLRSKAKKTIFNEEVTKAVKQFQKDNHLEPTGVFDDTTLTLLLWGMTPEELDLVMPINPFDRDTFPETVYVPVHGGKKRHATAECCEMDNPRKVSIRNAAAVGFEACKWDGCEAERERELH